MAEFDRHDVADANLDTLIQSMRSSNQLDARTALVILVEKLQNSGGYYVWASLGDDALATWQIRVPRVDLPDEPWLLAEDAEILHLCRPVAYLESVEKRDKDGSSDYVGYVREAVCTRCRREMPDKQRKKAEMQIKLHTLGKKR